MTQDKPPDDDGRVLSRVQMLLCLLFGVGLVFALALGVGAISSNLSLSGETTEEWELTEGSVVDADDGPAVELGADLTIDRRHPIPGDGSVDLRPEIRVEGQDGTSLRYDGRTADGLVQLEEIELQGETTLIHETEGEVVIDGTADRFAWQDPDLESDSADLRYGNGTLSVNLSVDETVRAVDTETGETIDQADAGDEITLDSTDDEWRSVTLMDSKGAPSVSNPQPADGATFNDSSSVDLEVDVDDPNFEHFKDESVTVTFYDASDDSVIGTDTLTEAGAASTTWNDIVMGENSWYAVAENSWGDSTESDQWTFDTPSELHIRDELTQDLIDESGVVNIRFLTRDGDSVITRSTTDGTVDMSGLPVGERFTAEANVDGYHTRSTLINSITRQQTLYLLAEQEDSYLTEFRIQDRTTNYPAEESSLIIQKPLPVGEGQEEFQTIYGDEFGAGNKLAVELAANERYRLIVRNDDGDERSLGSFRAERAELVELEIGTIELSAPDDRGFAFNARMADAEEYGENVVRISFTDPSGETDTLRYWIHDVQDEDDIVHEEVVVDNPGEISELVEVPENQTVAVSWEVDRGGETISGTENVGTVGPLDLPISGTMLQVLGISAIVLVAGLFGGSMSRMGAVVIVVMAWGMRLIGIVVVPYPFLIAAGIVALLFAIGDSSSTRGVPT